MVLTEKGKRNLYKAFSHMSKKDWQAFDDAEEEGKVQMGCHLGL